MIVHSTEDMQFTASVTPLALDVLTHGMSMTDKAAYLRGKSNWFRPFIGRDGVICVPDPRGGNHEVDHERIRDMDVFVCRKHGSCWATAAALYEYRAISVLKGNGMRFSKDAYALIGKPNGVAIFVDEGNNLVGFKPVSLAPNQELEPHVYRVSKDGNFSARNLVLRMGLETGRYAPRPDAGGLLAINTQELL